MKFASALSCRSDYTQAVTELLEGIDQQLQPEEVDLALFFSSAHHEDDLERIVGAVWAHLPKATLLGCTAQGTIGRDREVQRSCSMSLLAGSMPGVRLRPFHITQEQMTEAEGAVVAGRGDVRARPRAA